MRVRRGLLLIATPILGLCATRIAETEPEVSTTVWEDGPAIADEPALEVTPPPELAVPPRPIRVAEEMLERRIVRRRRLFADFVRVYAKTVHTRALERLARMRACADEADLAFRRGEFDAASRHAAAAVAEDPDNLAALQLLRLAHEAVAEADHRTAAARACDEGWEEARRRVIEATQPTAAPYEVEASSANIAAPIEREPYDPDAEASVIAKLEEIRVRDFALDDQDLDQVMARLRSLTGLRIELTSEARRSRFEDVRITVPGLDDVTARWLLTEVVTRPYDLAWGVRDGVVTIATKHEIMPQLRLKYFDTKDLAVKLQNFRGNEIFLSPSSYIPPEPPELEEPEPVFPADSLVEAIRSAVDPGSWDVRGASIDLKNGTLIVKHTRAAIESVGIFLEMLRETLHPSPELPPLEFHSIQPRSDPSDFATFPAETSTADR